MIAGVALLLGIVFLGYAFFLFRRGRQAEAWPKVEATITQVSIKHTGGASRGDAGGTLVQYYLPIVEYTYVVGPRTYKGDRIFAGEIQSMQHPRALDVVRPYKEGMKVLVSHDPANPARAVLESRADEGALTNYVVLGFLALAFAAWWRFA